MIPVYKPYLKGNEANYVNECIESTWISSKGNFIDRFESKLKKYVNRKFASSCSNGTTALDLAFKALGIHEGDEVITSNFTYVASTNAILINRAKPVFIDINLMNWNIADELIEERISEKTKAILVSNIYGYMPNIDAILKICEKHDLFLIEDAAESLGATYQGKISGSFGIVSTLSFFGNKTITTGEGGMVLTDDQSIYEKVEMLKNQGNSINRKYFHDILGYNYRMTNIQAAIGLAQLENIDVILDLKKRIYLHYLDQLGGNIIKQYHDSCVTNPSFWIMFVISPNL